MILRAISLLFLATLPLIAGCGDGRSGPAPAAAVDAVPSPSATPARRPNVPRVVVLGDSLTAGLGLDVEQSFPSLIQERLDREGHDYEVVNAGVSGDTSAGGLRRLEWALAEGHPKILIVALGGNDGLRGLPPEQLEANLASIIEQSQKRGLTVILAGMEAPPNFGADYTTRFRAVYPSLAARYKVRLLPFLLAGVAGDPALNQPDGVHPNPRGASIVADLVWRALQPELALTRGTTDR
ncbi:MAG TPA: arylesterase [Vicinamibacterales bacterium]|nr:arylesterase [Vicinamibacterales bacterium]